MAKTSDLVYGIGTALAIAISGGVIGLTAGYTIYSPKSVHPIQLNGDERVDLYVESFRGFKHPFIQQEDGTYERFETLQELELSRLNDSQQLKLEGIRAKLSE